jgi:hypothetical protein
MQGKGYVDFTTSHVPAQHTQLTMTTDKGRLCMQVSNMKYSWGRPKQVSAIMTTVTCNIYMATVHVLYQYGE